MRATDEHEREDAASRLGRWLACSPIGFAALALVACLVVFTVGGFIAAVLTQNDSAWVVGGGGLVAVVGVLVWLRRDGASGV